MWIECIKLLCQLALLTKFVVLVYEVFRQRNNFIGKTNNDNSIKDKIRCMDFFVGIAYSYSDRTLPFLKKFDYRDKP